MHTFCTLMEGTFTGRDDLITLVIKNVTNDLLWN